MKLFSTVILNTMVICLVTYANCDVRYRGNAVHPDYPGECYYEELEQAIAKTQTFKPINIDGHCEAIFCRPDFVLEMHFCSRHNLFSNATCQLESDMRLVFPKCCPKLVCQTSNYL